MTRVNKNRKLNILDAYHHREMGMLNRHHITQELLATAEDRLVTKEHDELSCEMPGMPRSTFLMVFSPDGTKVASTHGNHNVYVTDLRTGKNCNTLIGHPRTPWCIAFHPSSNQILATGCLGGQVRIWDLSGGSEVWTTECQTVIASLAFHPHDRLLVIATYNVLYFWDWSQPKPFMQTCTSNAKEKVRYVAFDRLGHKLITGIANMQASGSRSWERLRSSYQLFPSPIPIHTNTTRIPQPDIYLVRQNTHAWYTRRGNRPPRPSAFQSPARQINSTSSSSNTNINSNNNNSNNNNNTASNQNETDGSISFYERRIIQLYESLMQRFLEVYRTRVTSTMDRGTDPMEPIPLNSTSQTAATSAAPVTTSVSTTTTSPTSVGTATSSVTNAPPKEQPTISTIQNCKSPEAGPSGIQTTSNKKRLRSKKDNRRNLLQSDDEDSSSSSDTSSSSSSDGSNTGPPLMNLILEHIKRERVNTTSDQQASTSKTKSNRSIIKNLIKDRKRKISKRKKKKLLNFVIPDEDNDDQSEGEEDMVPSQQPHEQSGTTVPDVNVEMYQTMETPESASDSAVSYISSIPEESGELDFSGIELPRMDDDQHFSPNPAEPIQIDTSQWRSNNLISPEYQIIPDQPSTSSGSTGAEYFHVYGDNDVPVDLSSNGYAIDEDETTNQQRPHVDHNYMASTSSSTTSAAPSSSSYRGEGGQNTRPDKRVRAEFRQLQYIRYMCHKFQDLLNTNQSTTSHESPTANTTTSRNTESVRNSPAQLRRRNSFPRCVTFRPGNDDIIPSTSNPNSPVNPPRVVSFRVDVPSTSNNIQNPSTPNPTTSTADTKTAEKPTTVNSNPSNLTTRNSNLESESSVASPWCSRRLHVHHHHRLNRHIFGSILSHMKTQNDAVNLSRTGTATVSNEADDPNQRNHTNPITITEAIRRLQRNNPSTARRRANLTSTLLRRNDGSEAVPSNSSRLENNQSNLDASTSSEGGSQHSQHLLKIRRRANFLSSMLLRRTDNNETASNNYSRLENDNNQSNLESSQIPTTSLGTSGSQEINKSPINDIKISSNLRRENSQSNMDSSQSSREQNSPPRKMMKTSLDCTVEPSCSTPNLVRQNFHREINQSSPNSATSFEIQFENTINSPRVGEKPSTSDRTASNLSANLRSNIGRASSSHNSQNNSNSSQTPTMPTEKDSSNTLPRRGNDRHESSTLPSNATSSLRSNFVLRQVRHENSQSSSQIPSPAEPSCSTTNLRHTNLRSNLIRRYLRHHPHHPHIPLSPFRLRLLLRLFPPSSSTTTTSNPAGTFAGRASSENGTSSSSSSSDNQSSLDNVRKFNDINENMMITPVSIMVIIRRLEDLIRQQHTQQPAQNSQQRLTNPLRTRRYERPIHSRLFSLHSRLRRLGVELDQSSSFWNDRFVIRNENESGGRDIDNVHQGRHVLSIILIILMRYYENQHNNSSPTPRILTERLTFMLRLSIILTDTLLLNVIERLPAPDMPDTHEYILSTFRAIDDRIDAHERRRNLQNDRSQRSNYYIEDLSRMSVNDDPNENVPEGVASSSPTTHSSNNEATSSTGQSTTRRWDMEPELVPLSAETLLSRMRESQTRFREFFNTRISNLRNLRRSINNNMRAYHILDGMQRSLVPRVQVNDVPINDDAVINRPVRAMPLPQLRIPSDTVLNRDAVLNRPLRPMPLSQQRIPSGMFRPRFLHPLYGGGGGVLVDGDIDDTQREQIFGMGDDFPASACPNHRIQIWNMADGKIPSITNPDKNVVVSDCKIHNDASVDISQDGNLLVTLLPSGGYLNITNKLGVFSIQWDNLGQCLYTASFEQNAVSVSLSTTARYLAVGLASRRVSSLVPGSERCIMAQLYKLETDGRTLLARDIEKSRNLGTTSINCIRWSPVPGQGLVYATNSGHLKVLS